MSSTIKLLPIALSGLLVATAAMGAGPRGNQPATPVSSGLGAAEEQTLLFMREEEKVARDVYIGLNAAWGSQSPVFANIAEAEQSHMDALKRLVEQYGLSDPVDEAEVVGDFTDVDLGALYAEQLENGQVSYEAALRVGGLIEEVDIADLDEAIAETDKQDLKTVYENLRNGSYNHLRAFVAQLAQIGVPYENLVLGDDEYDLIIAGDRQTGSQGAGTGAAGNGGRGGRR
ncbi:DUF2202 domain-containing protein [Thiocystis violacea]|uniref:DUF2202 domain-containing protein n=1 Tax=Thiocystis violacea TaxID=13725 RepID=UPI001904104F|nr:DUF2202 domain-containing protein [Thiocystis violacea]MBK1724461.1 hypothetical protein [Thiocystis violacea]